jgi:lysozyme
MKTRSIAKKDIFMNISLGTKPGAMLRNRGSMYARYLDDLVPGERQEMVQDIAEVSELFLDDKELAVDIYKSQLEEIGKEYDDNKLQIFKAKLDDDTERLNFSIAIVSREGFVSSGVLPRETYDSTGIIGTKIVDKYSYDRFQGEIPALIGEGISTPAESKGKGFQVDKTWGKLTPDTQREMFDLHYNAIQKGKASESAKQLLTENLFNNIPHPDKYNFQEYAIMKRSKRGIDMIGGLGGSLDSGKTSYKMPTAESKKKITEAVDERKYKKSIKKSDNLIVQQLLSDEGYRTNVYKDSEGYLTVGIGHKLTDEEKEIYKEGDYVPTDVVKEFTENDINKFINITNEVMENKGLLDSKLYKENEDMFVSFFYQLGKDGGLGFNNMWDAIDKGDAQGAYDAALDSKWAKQTPRRAKRFAKMLKKEVK